MVSFSAWHFKNETNFCLKIWASISCRLVLCSGSCGHSSLFSLTHFTAGPVSKGVALLQNFSDLSFAVRSYVPNTMRRKERSLNLAFKNKAERFLNVLVAKISHFFFFLEHLWNTQPNKSFICEPVSIGAGQGELKKQHGVCCAFCSVSLVGNSAPTSDPGGRPAGCFCESPTSGLALGCPFSSSGAATAVCGAGLELW